MQIFKKRVSDIAQYNLGFSKSMEELLVSRGITNKQDAEKFLNPALDQIHSPLKFRDMEKCVSIINGAIKNKHKILVYGDYDCDGVCASYILSESIEKLGGIVDCFIPSRDEGYGLNKAAVTQISEKYKLLITVDLGITNCDEIILAKQLGLSVIISDHHQLPDTLPNADAIIHPHIKPYPYSSICGAGVAYKIAFALLGENAVDYLGMAAIATIADMVPLLDENRAIVALGLKQLNTSSIIGLDLLFQNSASSQNSIISSSTIAFQIAPRINAAGRMGTADIALNLLKEKDCNKAHDLACQIEELNNLRKNIENSIIDEANIQVENINFIDNKIVFIIGENWHNGIIGLVAGKICEKYYLPTIVLSVSGKTAVASIRSIPGINIYHYLKKCEKYFIKWGGHEQAAGLTILTENIDKFKSDINQYIIQEADKEIFIPVKYYDAKLDIDQASLELYDELELFNPTGKSNPSVLFMAESLCVKNAKCVGLGNKHLKLTLSNAEANINCIAFGLGDVYKNMPTELDCIYSLQKNTFNGNISVNLEIKAIKPTKKSIIKGINNVNFEIFAYKIVSDIIKSIEQYESFSPLNILSKKRILNNYDVRDVYGNLYIAYFPQTAIDFINKYGNLADFSFYTPKSSQQYNALLLLPEFDNIIKKYNNVVILDAPFSEEHFDYIQNLFPNSNISYINNKNDVAIDLQMDITKYRTIYYAINKNTNVSIKDLSGMCDVNIYQVYYALHVFKKLNLIEFSTSPYNVKINIGSQKVNLEESLLYRTINNII